MKKMKKIWNKIKHWCCKVGLCNLNKCACDCHEQPKGRSKAYYPTTTHPTAKTELTKVKAPVSKDAPQKKTAGWRDGPTPN